MLTGILQHLPDTVAGIINDAFGLLGHLTHPGTGILDNVVGLCRYIPDGAACSLACGFDRFDHFGIVLLKILFCTCGGFENMPLGTRSEFIEALLLHRTGLSDGIFLHYKERIEMFSVFFLNQGNRTDHLLRDGFCLFNMFDRGAQPTELFFQSLQ